ncbi:MAG TPA: peptidoglycan-binding domain-containing protein [Chthoniobacteraceae bacterium]|nr:peptidoglycan-binding domain-containing protein [Chthoniobacteraceae bacterium]
MKLTRILMVAVAAAALSVFTLPAGAQSRGRHGGNPNPGNMNHGNWHGGNWHGGNWHGGNWHNGHRVNFFVGGFGFPYFGYPYWGAPYYPYYYGYGYPYGYPAGAYYSYDPRGIYEGSVVNRGRATNEGGGKDYSMTARVQRQLADAGYYHGAIDGIAGNGTRSAIRNYERDNGLPVDGEIDNQLLATMGPG